MNREYVISADATKANALNDIVALPCDGKWIVKVELIKSFRSLAQQGLYRMWVTVIANETGHTHNEMHEFLSKEFIPIEIIEVMGLPVEVRKSTTKLLVGEFTTFLNHVEAFAGSLGIVLPHPPDQYTIATKKPH